MLVVIALASCPREPALVAPSPSARLRLIPLTTSSAEARAAFERGERLMARATRTDGGGTGRLDATCYDQAK